MEMLPGVPALRRVAAADVTADHTKAKMQPVVSSLQTLFTFASMRNHSIDLLEMFTFGHIFTPHIW